MPELRDLTGKVIVASAVVAACFHIADATTLALATGVGAAGVWDVAQLGLAGSGRWLSRSQEEPEKAFRQVMGRAFSTALGCLERQWWAEAGVEGRRLRASEPEIAWEVEHFFKRLRAHSDAFFSEQTPEVDGGSGETSQSSDADVYDVRQILDYGRDRAEQALKSGLEEVLGEQREWHPLVEFINRRLVRQVACCFEWEIEKDNRASQIARHVVERALLRRIEEGLGQLQAQQRNSNQRLGEVMDYIAPLLDQPYDTLSKGQQAILDRALQAAQTSLSAEVEQQSSLTREAVAAQIATVAALLSTELRDLRTKMLRRLASLGLVESESTSAFDLRLSFRRFMDDEEFYGLFGGRVDELDFIESFLSDASGGYLFVTGQSGYGKTALLTEVVRRRRAIANYFFINRVNGTDREDQLLRALCQQLANYHRLIGALPDSTDLLRRLYEHLVRLPAADGQIVVVVIDGLDEAKGWDPTHQIFPPVLPDGVKVIFSAREMAEIDWLQKLRLPAERVRKLPVSRMGAQDIADLLRAAGAETAPLADDRSWLSDALNVSDGDPFYIKLLVEDLQHGRLQPQEITGQPTGLKAYLENWFAEIARPVRKDDTYAVVATLSVAFGRLWRDDLVSLHPELGLMLPGVLNDIRRFIIGNNDDGYALCHPRFADFVRTLGGGDVSANSAKLLHYCERWSERTGRYAPMHYIDHLIEIRDWQRAYDVAATPTAQPQLASMRYELEGSYASYLANLERL